MTAEERIAQLEMELAKERAKTARVEAERASERALVNTTYYVVHSSSSVYVPRNCGPYTQYGRHTPCTPTQSLSPRQGDRGVTVVKELTIMKKVDNT